MVAPFPWGALAPADRRSSRVVAAARAWLRAVSRGATHPGNPDSRGATHPGDRRDVAEVRGAEVLEGEALRSRLGDGSAAVAVVRAGLHEGYVVVPGQVVRALAERVLGGPDELAVPRPPTLAERAVVAAAVATALDAHGAAAVTVEPCDLVPADAAARARGAAAVLDVAVGGAVSGTAIVVLPLHAALAAPRAPLADLAADAPAALLDVPVAAPLVVARVTLEPTEIARLRPRDVVVTPRRAPRGEAVLRVGRGGIRGGLAPAAGRVTVLAPYTRDDRTYPMDETLADDAAVDLEVVVGDVRMSVRALLELVPGQVLDLGRPLGTAVELRAGPRVVARGELVDVDGDVGVRIVSIASRADAPT